MVDDPCFSGLDRRQGIQVLTCIFWRRPLLGIIFGTLAGMPLHAAPPGPPAPPASQATRSPTSLSLEAGAGKSLTLPAVAANIFVADPKVAEVRPASPTSLFVFGIAPGRTTVAVMGANGEIVVHYEVSVRPSSFISGEAEIALGRILPEGLFKVTPQGKNLLLTGSVGSPADAARAVAILHGFLTEGQKVENQLSVRAAVQVNLRVRIVEMSRSVSRSLGVNWQALGSLGAFTTGYGLAATGAGAALGALKLGSRDANVVIDALAQDNLVRVLAEPNLTVISGEAGSFLVGGEFPIPVAQQNNQTTIEFKKYGVALRFVPTVMSDGRINLHVSPEVSQLTQQGAVQISAGNSSISIPALSVRRAETSVELGSGQTFALAGLLQDTVTTTGNGIPFLGDVPVLGALFRSSGFQRQETELVILVTPYVVRPVNDVAALHVPGEGFKAPTDFERILLLRQRGETAAAAPRRIPGQAGFIVQ
jgi:pilus assembly protein CpaC